MPGEDELIRSRREKLARLRDRGIDAYPARVARSHTCADAVAAFEVWERDGSSGDAPVVTVAGRIGGSRDMGKAAFLDLRDGSGRVQCFLKRDRLGDAWDLLPDLDLGDFIAVSGVLMRTRAGEVSVEASEMRVVTKALRPPPEKWHGVEDTEIRLRQRYLDLMTSEETRDVFRKRAQIVAAVRRFLDGRGFMEVETPALQAEAGGAAATPFETYYRALDQQTFLRISLELYLKRLLVGGIDKLYELGRIFRNEGLSRKNNPEFTMVETYEAYADYNDVAKMTEQMISAVALEVLGTTSIRYGDHDIDLSPPWARITMRDALKQHGGIDFAELRTRDALAEELQKRGIAVEAAWTWGKLVDEAVSAFVEPHLIQPTFLMDHPRALSPLAKRKPGDDDVVERFEAYVAGFELCNAYSELNDPEDQRLRFAEQARLQAAGAAEIETGDEDFLVALEHGMPPAGGFGMGIDRLVMLLTNQHTIREVILFPQLRRRD